MKPLDLTQPLTAKVATRLPIKQAWLDEVTDLIPNLTIEVVETKKQMAVWYNASQKSNYGVFASMRQIVDTDSHNIRAFYMPIEDFVKLGITNHLALYDNADRDNVLDFYVGLKPRLDPRAKANGFKSNFAWEFIHEILHGLEQNEGNEWTKGDRTHDKEAEGKLKELLTEHLQTLPKLKKSFLEKLMEYLGLLQKQVPTTLLHPIPEKYRRVTQLYSVPNPIYTLTRHHIGTDYACPTGTPIYAPWDGESIEIGYSKALGNYCVYEFKYKAETYAMRVLHQGEMPIKGKYKRGDVIGHSGNTGMSTGAHTHLDVFKNKVDLVGITADNYKDRTVDPQLLFN